MCPLSCEQVHLPPAYPSLPTTTEEHRRAYHRLRDLQKERTALVTHLKWAALCTLGTMALAVFALAFARYVCSWKWGVSIIGAFLFAVCFCMYWPVLAALWERDAQG